MSVPFLRRRDRDYVVSLLRGGAKYRSRSGARYVITGSSATLVRE